MGASVWPWDILTVADKDFFGIGHLEGVTLPSWSTGQSFPISVTPSSFLCHLREMVCAIGFLPLSYIRHCTSFHWNLPDTYEPSVGSTLSFIWASVCPACLQMLVLSWPLWMSETAQLWGMCVHIRRGPCSRMATRVKVKSYVLCWC